MAKINGKGEYRDILETNSIRDFLLFARDHIVKLWADDTYRLGLISIPARKIFPISVICKGKTYTVKKADDVELSQIVDKIREECG